MPKKYRSDALAAIHETMEALHDVGAINKQTMREFDETCLTPVHIQPPDSHCLRPQGRLSGCHHGLHTRRDRMGRWFQNEESNMKCLHCQGEMKKGETSFHIDRKGCHLTLDRVPVWVCSQCGEPYFEAAEVDAIQDLVQSVEEKSHAIALAA